MKRLIFILLFLSFGCATQSKDPLSKKYPYARLTPDYGILNEDDLQLNQRYGGRPAPLSKNLNAYLYWQCFDTSKIHFFCQDLKSIQDGSPMASMEIRADINTQQRESYWGRRGIPAADCHTMVKEWQRPVQNEKLLVFRGLRTQVTRAHLREMRAKFTIGLTID
ncbi:MAG: hypothetical protein WCG27_12535 [Pseudomonadota bacterium]